MSKDAPCKNCSERHYGCHAECDKYASYCEKKRMAWERRVEAQTIEKGFVEHSCRLAHRLKHNKIKSKIIRSPKR